MDTENFSAVDEWEDIELDEPEADEPETDAPQQADQPETDQSEAQTDEAADSTQTQTDDQPNTETETEKQPEPEQFLLKHLGAEKSVSRQEVITLAQKGMDYDRIHTKLDEMQPELDRLKTEAKQNESILTELRALARESGYGSLDELVDETRATVLSKRENVDMSIARGRIALERRERAIAAREEALNNAPPQQQQTPPDLLEFVQRFPEVKATDIPAEVWDAMKAGQSLTQAYSDWKSKSEIENLKAENKKLSDQLEAQKKAAGNRQKSTGSRQGLSGISQDEIDRIWDETD